MKINIEVIPHKQERYNTIGDYWIDDKEVVQIRVSELGNRNQTDARRYEFLVILHELIEMGLCKFAGVDFRSIDNFDKDYESQRQPEDMAEPGDDPKAPYKKQHLIATGIEKIVAAELGVDWQTYETTAAKV